MKQTNRQLPDLPPATLHTRGAGLLRLVSSVVIYAACTGCYAMKLVQCDVTKDQYIKSQEGISQNRGVLWIELGMDAGQKNDALISNTAHYEKQWNSQGCSGFLPAWQKPGDWAPKAE